jgi:hypothetical protein
MNVRESFIKSSTADEDEQDLGQASGTSSYRNQN